MNLPKTATLLVCGAVTAILTCSAALCQTPADTTKPAAAQKGISWTEFYEGSGDSSGWYSDINSTVGYTFGPHFSVYLGAPYYLFDPGASTIGVTAASGVGNPYLGFNISKKISAVNFSTGVNASVPISNTQKNGLSTGRVTFDWSNHFDHDFGWIKPFATLGVANTTPDSRYFFRPYTSLGTLAHFEAGPEFDLGDKFSVTISAYDLAPWGTQKTYVRGKTAGNNETTGGASLTRDYGMNLGVDYNFNRVVDAYAGYSRSTALSANTFSVGIACNVSQIFKRGPVR